MADTFDTATPIGKVRLLAFDFDTANYLLHDNEIQAFLDLSNQDVMFASALAVDMLAANQSFVYKHAKTGDVLLPMDKVTAGMHEYASTLRKQASEGYGDMTGFIDWIEVVNDDFSKRERAIKQFIRTQQ
jgi:hypothetical protein